MRRQSKKILFLVVATGFLSAGLAEAENLPESQDIPLPLALSYTAWVSSLEQDTPATAVWQFPFGAPQPSGLSEQELKIVVSLRRLVLNGNPEEMEPLADQVARRQGVMPAQMLFWLAYTQGQLGQQEACLANLRKLLMIPEAWPPLEKGQRAWVLTETADLLFLLDNRTEAAGCYARLSVSPVDHLRLWGQFQLAGMAFLDRDFEQASERYHLVCEGDKPATWRGHACAMATIAERLSRLGKEGEARDDFSASGP